MSSFPERQATALLVVDMQNGVLNRVHDRDQVVGRVASVVDKARRAGVAVVWIQHHSDELPYDSDGWAIVPELAPAAGEAVVEKRYGDSFEATELSEVLSSNEVGRVVVVGAQTDACVRSTLHGAFVRGYDTVLVTDAHTTEDLTDYGAPPPAEVISHTNLYWQFQTAPDRRAETVSAAEVVFD